MTVSVMIATKNRAAELYETVSNVLEQTRLPDEVVIVDQSPDSRSRDAVLLLFERRRAAARLNPHSIYLLDPTVPGAAAARNIGIERSSGDVVVLLDDDVLLEPDFLSELLPVYESDSDVLAVSGIATNYEKPPLSQRLLLWLFWRGPFHDERQSIYWQADRLLSHPPIRVHKLATAAMGLRRAALNGARLDGRLLGLPRGGDVDLCCRLEKRGKLVIAPRARFVHKRTPTNRPKSHWLRQDAQPMYYLYKRNWNHGIKNRLCFGWLNLGYILLATVGSLRRRSLEPWRALLDGIREAHAYF